tara:strand:- start:18072 stop:18809 length:738 start_codon:yes stop_codon:yes gene_type:complete
MNYLDNSNKEVLWSTLQESDIFVGIENSNFSKIKSIFETTMHKINENHKNTSLINKNKLTVNELIKLINKEKEKSKKLKVVYKSEPLDREQIFNIKLKEQQDNLNQTINVKKPEDIDFSDNNNNDNPIGNEMDQLIAEKLASRERELEMLTENTEDAKKWINGDEKKVAFDLNDKFIESKEDTMNMILDDTNNLPIKEEQNDSIKNMMEKLKVKNDDNEILKKILETNRKIRLLLDELEYHLKNI